MLANFRLAKSFGRLLRSVPTSATKSLGLPSPAPYAFRLMSGRKDCEEDTGPRCSPESIAKNPCAKRKEKAKKKKKSDSKVKSMWENPECCKDPCPDVMPRFDELYYRISDKAKRKYRQTWVECPELKIRKKPVCCFKNVKLPPLERRPRKKVVKTACVVSKPDVQCKKDKGNRKCPKITMPCCRGARDPPKCIIIRKKKHCKKVCAPYPSFSECKRPKPKPKRPVECNCLAIQSMCEVWAELRKMKSSK